ncbi:MAG TPA: outer membrane protein transport protein, partial [Albitalea sp.]
MFDLERLRPAMLASLCAASFTALPALATQGYFSHGYGMKATGMGGVALALAHDTSGGANNPASMVWIGTRLDLGAEVFRPYRDAERRDAALPSLNGRVESGRTAFLIPEFGYAHALRSDLSVGVSVYGNGGMNTSYPQGSFDCGAGPANILCGQGKLGVDLMQLVVAPTVSYRLTERHSIGASLLLAHQRFKAEGLQAFDNAPGFPAFTGAPGSVTNRGTDSANGVGIRVGWLGRLGDTLSIGAAYAPRIRMGRFEKYEGLFAGGGDFDIPSHYGVGVAITPTPSVTVAADWLRINYSEVPSVGRSSLPLAPLGAPDGPGFGWRDVDVLKVGAEWRL